MKLTISKEQKTMKVLLDALMFYKDKGYLDAKRMDQAEALNFAIFLVKQETPELKRK